MTSHGLPVPPDAPPPPPGAPGGPSPLLSRWQKLRMVIKVVELRLRFVVLMAATGLVFGYWDTIWNHYEKWSRPAGPRVAAASDAEHFCPMHPTVIQAGPGSCPICGMPLSRRKKGESPPLPAGVTARVALSPMRVAQAGIRTAEVGYAPLAETVTTVGSVTFDERRLARISSKTKGMARVEKLLVNFDGTHVKAGEPLAELYSPELYQAIRELLLAQRSAHDRARPQSALGKSILGEGVDLVSLAREKLALWGITPKQVDEILARGKADYRVPILSPIGGIVVRKNVFEGQYVSEGEAMFEVADLTRVWIQAQVYEDQVALVREGQAVEATVEAYPGEVFRGTVAFRAPALNPATRTLTVRYDLENADLRLQPGMFATVILKTPIADTAAFRRVVDAAPGTDPSRTATLTAEQQKSCPVTRLKLGSMGAPVSVKVLGRNVWMCCANCQEKLEAQPARYLAHLAPAPKHEVLTVPESAVVDTGAKKVVFVEVESEPGVFEGRQVVLGPLSGSRYPVLDGLWPGERVAAEGAFLIDAETRLNSATSEGTPRVEAARPPRAASATEAVHRH